MKRIIAFAALVAVLVAGLSFDFSAGDLRYNLVNHTFRHWDWVVSYRPACAFVKSGGFPCGSSAAAGGGSGSATSYTLTGPSTGLINTTSSNFTVQANGTTTALVTPADASHGGVFSPATVNLSNVSPVNFTYTPLQTGTFNISTTNGGALTNPAAISFSIPNIAVGYPGMAGGTWIGQNDGTLATGVAGDPFGGSAAAKLTEGTATGALHNASAASTFAVTPTQTYTSAIMVKNGSGTRQFNWHFTASDFSSGAILIISPGTCTGTTVSWGSTVVNGTTFRTANLASGWCLAEMSVTPGFSTAINQAFLNAGGNETYTGDGASNILMYGPIEQ